MISGDLFRTMDLLLCRLRQGEANARVSTLTCLTSLSRPAFAYMLYWLKVMGCHVCTLDGHCIRFESEERANG